MKMGEYLTPEQKRLLNVMTKAKSPVKKRMPKQEKKLSQRELHDLMGISRDTYKRVNGKVRRK